MNKCRIILGTTVILILILLYFESSPSQQRITAINDAVSKKQFLLQDVDITQLQSIVDEIVMTVEGVDKIVINGHVDSRVLNLYTTTSETSYITYCGAGNAIYDASISAIFIDESIVCPLLVNTLYGYESVSPSRMNGSLGPYFKLTLLHEIGHHVLHGKTSGFFDLFDEMDQSQIRREGEADDFASKHFLKLPSSRKPIEHSYNPGANIAVNQIKVRNLQPNELAAARLASTVHVVNRGMLFSESPYSPYYKDRGHKVFVQRMLRALTFGSKMCENVQVKTIVALARETLIRTEEGKKYIQSEILVPEAIKGVKYLAGKLFVAGEKQLHWINSEWTPDYSIRSLSTSNFGVSPAQLLNWLSEQSGVKVVAEGLSGFTLSMFPSKPLDSRYEDNVWLNTGEKKIKLSGVKLNSAMHRLSQLGAPENFRIGMISALDEKTMTSGVYNARSELWGIAHYSVIDQAVKKLHALQIGDKHFRFVDPIVMKVNGKNCCYLVENGQNNPVEFRHDELNLWHVGADHEPRLISSCSLLTSLLPKKGRERLDWFPITIFHTNVWHNDHGKILISVLQDSLYSYDVVTGNFECVFYPGGTHYCLINGGNLVVFVYGGRKMFVLSL